MRKILLIFVLLYTTLFAITFDEYKKQQTTQYQNYKNNLDKEFRQYKKAYQDAFKKFKSDLQNHWPKNQPFVTTKHKFIEYSPNLKNRKIVDYQHQNILLQTIAKNQQEATKRFNQMFDSLYREDVKQAYKNDILEKMVLKELKQKTTIPNSSQKIISDMINHKQKKILKSRIKPKNYKTIKYKKQTIYSLRLKFPTNAYLTKAKRYKNIVNQYGKKEHIPYELIYAIIDNESSFNPMARSYVPAFGLMQIVPQTAGRDTYKYLYNKDRMLHSSYLYNEKNNIKIGSGYLHILYYRYLRGIKDPTSRLFCAICAYNTGAGNVAKAFVGNHNIYQATKKINNMTSIEVYGRLIKYLPYKETKRYLKKVYKKLLMYDQLIKTDFAIRG
jgi:membrane-bound lytic murein transglycosylase C